MQGARPISGKATSASGLIPPYGDKLVNLIVPDARADEMKATAKDFASITLDERALCDLELLAVGGYSPLTGFLGKADYDRVVAESRLANGTFWPIPVTLPVKPGDGIEAGRPLALRDVYGNLLAFLNIEELFEYDKDVEARGVYGTNDASHPSVAYLQRSAAYYASGRLEVIRVPPHLDFVELRHTPAELREHFTRLGWNKIVAYQPDDLIHRADEELIKLAAEQIGGGLLIHPAVGIPKPGDVAYFTRVRCYRALVDTAYKNGSVVLSLLPMAMRKSGPREALFNAIIRRNYGCTDQLLGRSHADPGVGTKTPFDDSGEAQETWAKFKDEIGIGMVQPIPMVYLPDQGKYLPVDQVPSGSRTNTLTEAQVYEDYLARGIPLPEWFTRPAVAAILNETHPPKYRQGLTIWFTGLSGSGKSTVAHALVERLAEFGRNVSILDGDEIRTHLSKGLSFSKDDRDTNINRVGYVAGLIAQHGGTTLCSVISPYRENRENARQMSKGNFVEVFCDTPIEVCEKRDVKGLYAKARAGEIKGFTGIDDPYEPPLNPEVTIDTSRLDAAKCADVIIQKLIELRYLLPHGHIDSLSSGSESVACP